MYKDKITRNKIYDLLKPFAEQNSLSCRYSLSWYEDRPEEYKRLRRETKTQQGGEVWFETLHPDHLGSVLVSVEYDYAEDCICVNCNRGEGMLKLFTVVCKLLTDRWGADCLTSRTIQLGQKIKADGLG